VDPKRSVRGGALPPLPPALTRQTAPGASPGGGGAAGRPLAGAGGAPGGAAAALAAQAPLGEVIDRLAADLQRLRIDFERFFSGALLMPPEDLRHRVQTQLRAVRNSNAGTAVDRFRLADIEARFNSYNELFNRRLRDREEGRQRLSHQGPAPSAVRYDPTAGIVIARHPDPDAVSALYQALSSAGQEGAGGPRFDLATFGSYLQRQAAAIRDKTGCEDVQFRLAAEDGKLKLKARPLGVVRSSGT
jgi:hypothetical protein